MAINLYRLMAERVGFEPTVPLTVRLISSQVHSTTLPPLRVNQIIPAVFSLSVLQWIYISVYP